MLHLRLTNVSYHLFTSHAFRPQPLACPTCTQINPVRTTTYRSSSSSSYSSSSSSESEPLRPGSYASSLVSLSLHRGRTLSSSSLLLYSCPDPPSSSPTPPPSASLCLIRTKARVLYLLFGPFSSSPSSHFSSSESSDSESSSSAG